MSIDINKGNKIDCRPLHVQSEAYFKGVGDIKLSKDNMYRLVKEYEDIHYLNYCIIIPINIKQACDLRIEWKPE